MRGPSQGQASRIGHAELKPIPQGEATAPRLDASRRWCDSVVEGPWRESGPAGVARCGSRF